jgi:hypothetical protein
MFTRRPAATQANQGIRRDLFPAIWALGERHRSLSLSLRASKTEVPEGRIAQALADALASIRSEQLIRGLDLNASAQDLELTPRD